MSQKISAQTSTFEVLNTAISPDDYVLVGGVSTIRDMRSGSAAEIDVSDLSSTAKEFRLGLADNGSMAVDLFYDPEDEGQILLEALRDSSSTGGFRVTVPNPDGSGNQTTVFTFQGLVTTFPFTAGVDTVLSGTVTVRVTGAFAKTAGA